MGVNNAELIGHLGADPEVHTFEDGGKIANFSIATTDKWNDKQTGEKREHTEWHRIVVRGGLAKVVEQYLKKGAQVYIKGSMRTRKYQDSTGADRYITEVHCNQMEMLGGNPNSQNSQANQGATDDSAWYENQSNQAFSQDPTVNS